MKKKYLHCVEVKIWLEYNEDEETEAVELIESNLSFTKEVWEKIKDISFSENVSLVREVKNNV